MICCIGVNYKKVSLEIRERYAFSKDEQKEFHRILRQKEGIFGSVIISTCNRSEIYFCGEEESAVIGRAEEALAEYKNLPKEEVLNQIYVYSGERALHHLFFVAGGLDSMVLGEDEILHQLKEGYQLALEEGMTCHTLNIAFQGAMGSAKSIKTETLLSKTSVSVGTLAANRIDAFLKEAGADRVMIVGITGKIGSILAKNLYAKGIKNLVGTSRKHGGWDAGEFWNLQIPIIDFKDRYDYADEMDVIVSASSGPHYTFTAEKIRNSLRTKKQRLFIDMAVPRDMDTYIAKLPGCSLIDIDDFKRLAEQNNRIKLKETDKAEALIAEKLEETCKSIYMSEFLEKKQENFQKLKKREFGEVFYQIKDRIPSEHLKALLEVMEQI